MNDLRYRASPLQALPTPADVLEKSHVGRISCYLLECAYTETFPPGHGHPVWLDTGCFLLDVATIMSSAMAWKMIPGLGSAPYFVHIRVRVILSCMANPG